MRKRFLAIGECMIEIAPANAGLYRAGYAGDTFNTAYYAASLLPSGWTTAYLSAVGDDKTSGAMLAFMEDYGVSTRHVRRISGLNPGLYLIHLEGGERSFSYWRGQSAARRLADDPAFLDSALADTGLAYFSGITLAILGPQPRENLHAALAKAKTMGSRIAFDPNIRPRLWENAETMRGQIMRFAALADIVLPSFDDEKEHFGDADTAATLARYESAGASLIAVKDGANGAIIGSHGTIVRVAAEKVAEPVDTTGAGDSFNAAFLACHLLGRDPVSAAGMANGLAGAVIRHRGALMPRDSIPAF
jgi:2-dehydro-3-deoxygluconokinase